MRDTENRYIVIDVCNKIHELVHEKGLKQRKFCQMMGKTDAWYHSILMYGHNIRLATVKKCCEKLNVDVKYLFGGKYTKYKSFEWDIDTIINTPIPYLHQSLRSIRCLIKRKKRKTMSLSIFLEFCDAMKLKPTDLIKYEEKKYVEKNRKN